MKTSKQEKKLVQQLKERNNERSEFAKFKRRTDGGFRYDKKRPKTKHQQREKEVIKSERLP